MAYDLLDLRARVRAKIKDSSYPADTIDGFVNDSLVEIADLMLVKKLQRIISGSLTINEHTYEQQSDHQLTSRLVLIDPTSSNATYDMTKWYMPSNEFFGLYPAPDLIQPGLPSAWTEYGDQIYFNCPVNKAYTLRQFYQKLPNELVDTTDVPELPRNYREHIVLGAVYRCEEERGNYDIAAIIQNRFNDRVSDLMMRYANETSSGPDTVVIPYGKG